MPWVSIGKANKKIAAELDIGEGTRKVHLKRILETLKALSRIEAVHLAQERGLLET